MAFALAQRPYLLPDGNKIASLAPLMDLNTGETFNSPSSVFPDDGYVFWWSIPTGEWEPGDLIVGTLEKSRKYGEEEQSWYQVQSKNCGIPVGEVFEYIKTSLSKDQSLRCLIDGRKPLDISRQPAKNFYVSVGEQLVGPFTEKRHDHFSSETAFGCTPLDATNGVVQVHGGEQIQTYIEKETGYSTAVIALSDSLKSNNANLSNRKYRLIRKSDIDGLSETISEKHLLPDELIISRACQRISGRKKKREIRDTLNSLLKELVAEETSTDQENFTAIGEMVSRLDSSNKLTDQVVKSLIQSGTLNSQIKKYAKAQADKLVESKADEIRAAAEGLAKNAVAEIDHKNAEIEKKKEELDFYQSEVDQKKAEIALALKEVEEHQGMTGRITEAAKLRLSETRELLMADIALLAPLFGSVQNSAPSNKLPQYSNGEAGVQEKQEASLVTTGEPLSKTLFIKRLLQILTSNGCAIHKSHAMQFQALVSSSKFFSVPHPGWVASYCEALGGTGVFNVLSVEPTWMSFSEVFSARLKEYWELACRDTERIHFIVLEGVDRCPSQAWIQPWLHVLAGWSHTLPSQPECVWPDNLRLVLTFEKSENSFPISSSLVPWVIPFSSSVDEPEPALEPIEGHFKPSDWLQPNTFDGDGVFSGILKEAELPAFMQSSVMLQDVAKRLASFYADHGEEEDRISRYIEWMLKDVVRREVQE